jgi:hypothetical protein
MDQSSGQPGQPVTILPTKEDYPPWFLPTIYADGIANLAPSNQVVKFYLYRTDPHVMAKPEQQNQLVAQIILPIPSFVFTAVFFEKALKQFVAQGNVPQSLVDTVRAVFEGT